MKLAVPVYAAPKQGGVSVRIRQGQALSKSPIVNPYVLEVLSSPALEGWDGQITVGITQGCTKRTEEALASRKGEPLFTMWAMDFRDPGDFQIRHKKLRGRLEDLLKLGLLPTCHFYMTQWKYVWTRKELKDYLWAKHLLGYPGIIIQDPQAPYGEGRQIIKEFP